MGLQNQDLEPSGNREDNEVPLMRIGSGGTGLLAGADSASA